MFASRGYESIVGFATALITLAGMAVMGKGLTGAIGYRFSQQSEAQRHRSIPPEKLRRIAEKYGWWAARRAEASVPHMDVEACEREAKRLYESMVARRF